MMHRVESTNVNSQGCTDEQPLRVELSVDVEPHGAFLKRRIDSVERLLINDVRKLTRYIEQVDVRG